jgi:hypothetical protein
MLAMMAEANPHNEREHNSSYKKPTETQPQKGQFTYWFYADGGFVTSRKNQIASEGHYVFKCFAINDKNAIKKFNAFIKANQ